MPQSRSRPFILALCAAACAGFAPACFAQEAPLMAGAAETAFRLPEGVPLAGYSRRKGRPSEGVHDPVGVRALVLRRGSSRFALVSADLLIVDERVSQALREELRGRGLPEPLTLMVAATHTHAGPGAYGARFAEKISMGHYDPAVFGALIGAIADSVEQADAAAVPVRLSVGSARAPEAVKNRINDGGFVDDEVVCVIARPAGQGEAAAPIAVAIGFSAHPTTLGAWFMQLSADYPGVVRRELSVDFPGTVWLFFAGAVGDQAPVKRGDGFERAEWVGRRVAEAAREAMAEAVPASGGVLETREALMPLPPARIRMGVLPLPGFLAARLVDDDASLSAAVADGIAFIGLPCDMTAGLGAALKAEARGRGWHPLLVGFANDYIGYCVPPEVYEHSDYEAAMAFNGPDTGALIVERLSALLADIARGPSGAGEPR
ncbi:MAG TPA: neutral/alkaline non-lysosomal ceramidase N-terminal domain-containing protein [bacterium]